MTEISSLGENSYFRWWTLCHHTLLKFLQSLNPALSEFYLPTSYSSSYSPVYDWQPWASSHLETTVTLAQYHVQSKVTLKWTEAFVLAEQTFGGCFPTLITRSFTIKHVNVPGKCHQ